MLILIASRLLRDCSIMHTNVQDSPPPLFRFFIFFYIFPNVSYFGPKAKKIGPQIKKTFQIKSIIKEFMINCIRCLWEIHQNTTCISSFISHLFPPWLGEHVDNYTLFYIHIDKEIGIVPYIYLFVYPLSSQRPLMQLKEH